MRKILIMLFTLTVSSIFAEDYGITATDRLRIRDNPSLESETVGFLPENSQVIILSKSTNNTQIGSFNSGWYYIQKDDLFGWVYAAYLIPIFETPNEYDYVCQMSKDGFIEQYHLKIIYKDENMMGEDTSIVFVVFKEANHYSGGQSRVAFTLFERAYGKDVFSGNYHSENAGGEYDNRISYDYDHDRYVLHRQLKGWENEEPKIEPLLVFNKKLSLTPPYTGN